MKLDLVYNWMIKNGYHFSVPFNLDLFLKNLNYYDCFTGSKRWN